MEYGGRDTHEAKGTLVPILGGPPFSTIPIIRHVLASDIFDPAWPKSTGNISEGRFAQGTAWLTCKMLASFPSLWRTVGACQRLLH